MLNQQPLQELPFNGSPYMHAGFSVILPLLRRIVYENQANTRQPRH